MKIRKQDPRKYKTITIGTQTYIMDEKMALDLMRTMSEEFNWASWLSRKMTCLRRYRVGCWSLLIVMWHMRLQDRSATRRLGRKVHLNR